MAHATNAVSAPVTDEPRDYEAAFHDLYQQAFGTGSLLEQRDAARREVIALTREREELRAEVERLRMEFHREHTEHGIVFKEVQDENERLRAALTEIIDFELEGDASLDDAMRVADETLNPPA